MPYRTIDGDPRKCFAMSPCPYSCTRIETKAQPTQVSTEAMSLSRHPRTAIISQKSGWMRTGMSRNRKRRSYGVEDVPSIDDLKIAIIQCEPDLSLKVGFWVADDKASRDDRAHAPAVLGSVVLLR